MHVQASAVKIAPKNIVADGDRGNGMDIVVEYANAKGKAQWMAPPPFRRDSTRFANAGAAAAPPGETFEMLIEKANAAEDGFNR